MDAFDARLLELIQGDNRLTTEQLGAAVCLSPTACQRRLKKLRERGVIRADVALLAPEKVGRPMTMVVQVSLEREQSAHLDAFKRTMRDTPEVQQCYYVTGDADFVLILTARDMQDYERFAREHFFDNPNIRHFTTNVVMDSVKVGLTVPVVGSEY